MRRSKLSSVVAWPLSLVLVCSTLSPSLAFAQGGKPAAGAAAKKPAPKKKLKDTLTGDAKAAFERGSDLIKNGNPDGAFSEFERAYSLQKDPRLLFNMAVAARDSKKYAKAVELLNQELAEGTETLSDDEKKTAQEVLDGLKQYTSALTVTSNETGATVLIDEVEVGKTPLDKPVLVSVGERKITVRKAEFKEETRTIQISGGTPQQQEFKLEPREKKGHLVVRAKGAADIAVFVDGTERGAPPFEGDVLEGPHTVELRARGFVTETRTEKVEFKGTTVIEVSLRPEQGKVRIETDKEENAIAIDGNKVGSGTWEGVLPSGGHQLVVTRDGAEPYQSDLAIQTDQSRTVKVTLKSKGGIAWYWWTAGGVVIAGGVVAAILLAKPKTEDPTPGTINPGTVPVGLKF